VELTTDVEVLRQRRARTMQSLQHSCKHAFSKQHAQKKLNRISNPVPLSRYKPDPTSLWSVVDILRSTTSSNSLIAGS
jgi:hypothetical protein